MTASTKPEEQGTGTSVATTPRAPLPANIQASVDERRARNQMVTAIRSTQWGVNATPELARSIAEYCRQNNLDPVRHVELLGGRIYLTAALYDEKGAHLIRSGEIIPDEPDYINDDPRLEAIEKSGTEGAKAWAREESMRRLKARIQFNVPEKSLAAVVQRFRIASTGAVITGVNWCGGNGRKDPVGEAEPAKTAQTRARRRAWTQIADVIPGYAEIIRPLEATAKIVSAALPVSVVEQPGELTERERRQAAALQLNRGPDAQFDEDPYSDNARPTALWASESGDGRRIGGTAEPTREVIRRDPPATTEEQGELGA